MVLYDKRGCGESDRDREAFSLEADLTDLRAVITPFGRAVVMAARLLSQAQGGQILTSDVARQIVSGGTFVFKKAGGSCPKGLMSAWMSEPCGTGAQAIPG